MVQCRGKQYDESQCMRENVQGSDWCIFHHPKKQGKLVSDFVESFESELEIQKREHPDYLDFSGFYFPIRWRFTRNF